MKNILVALFAFFSSIEPVTVFELDYEKFIPLDAEDLAEGGIKKAYQSLLPELRQHVAHPAAVTERLDSVAPSYAVSSAGKSYLIYAPTLDETRNNSWGLAAWALFSIVNQQMQNSKYKFYAINGGNDLGGMFLTKDDVRKAKESLPKKSDWPYLPKNIYPGYGGYE